MSREPLVHQLHFENVEYKSREALDRDFAIPDYLNLPESRQLKPHVTLTELSMKNIETGLICCRIAGPYSSTHSRIVLLNEDDAPEQQRSSAGCPYRREHVTTLESVYYVKTPPYYVLRFEAVKHDLFTYLSPRGSPPAFAEPIEDILLEATLPGSTGLRDRVRDEILQILPYLTPTEPPEVYDKWSPVQITLPQSPRPLCVEWGLGDVSIELPPAQWYLIKTKQNESQLQG